MRSGMIVVNKEPGYTSSDVVAKLRGILHMRKTGHTGTLDPAAEGVLPVCIGYATRLCDLIAAKDKEYEAVLRLGVTTDTGDATGAVLSQISDDRVRELLAEEARQDGMGMEAFIERAAGTLRGTIRQTPPRYSAIRIKGQHAYDLARKGVEFQLPSREVTIYDLEITRLALPLVEFRVTCSPGTYVRTLCEDLGRALGTGGTMEHLTRTRVGTFTLEKALRLGEIEQLMREDPVRLERDYLYSTDSFFSDCPAVQVREDAMPYLRNGNPLSGDNLMPAENKLIPAFPEPEEELPVSGRTGEGEAREQEVADPGAGSLPLEAGNRVRVYGAEGDFYGLYEFRPERNRLVCVKMFHAVESTRNDRR